MRVNSLRSMTVAPIRAFPNNMLRKQRAIGHFSPWLVPTGVEDDAVHVRTQ